MAATKGFESKLQKKILLSTEINVSFENFPYCLDEFTKNLLILSTNLNLKYPNFAKVTSDLTTLARSILLFGPTGPEEYQWTVISDPVGYSIYQETLIKALAKHFGVKLMIVEPKEVGEEGLRSAKKRSSSMLRRVFPSKREVDGFEKDDIKDMFEVVCSESRNGPVLVYLKQADGIAFKNIKVRKVFKEGLRNIPENVVIVMIVSSVGMRRISSDDLFTRVIIELPEDEVLCEDLKLQLERDINTLKTMSNAVRIRSVLNKIGLDCDDLESLCITDQVLLRTDCLERVARWALSHHLVNNPNVSDERESKIVLSCESIKIGFDLLERTKKKGVEKTEEKTVEKTEEKSEIDENAVEEIEIDETRKSALKKLLNGKILDKYEDKLLADVILSDEIGVTFDDVGALENIKETLKDMVMLPLERPELFIKGDLRKPCKGILLFGPPGTGKTMMAKALATEAGANFLNISMSSIMSRWVGKGEKFVKASFSLATKISPCVIFIDEVDSFLEKREHGEQSHLRKMKNEFMINWDGLRTNANERVIVLAATNSPYDLDEAVLRRLPRRLMVNLPDAANREKILKIILANEQLSPSIDLETIANMTEGYSGSDLKNLCISAAHYPIKDLLEYEKERNIEALRENRLLPPICGIEDIRPIHMDDFKNAHKNVCASVSPESPDMMELLQWNERYGEGGSRKEGKPLSYYI